MKFEEIRELYKLDMINRKEAANMVIENGYTDGEKIFKCLYCGSDDIKSHIVDYSVNPHKIITYKCDKCDRLSSIYDCKFYYFKRK